MKPKSKREDDLKTKTYWVRVLMVACIFSTYLLCFSRLYLVIGDGAFVIMQIIPVLAGSLLGLAGGLVCGTIVSPVIIFLAISAAGYGIEDAMKAGIPASFTMLLLGGGVGLLRNLVIRLRREVEERKRAEEKLQQSKNEADAANRAKSEFLANMSHEFRTPLNHIIGFTEIVVDKNFGSLNEIQEEYLNDVLHSSRHLLSLINDILDLAKIEAGKMELKDSDVKLKALLQNSLNMFKEKAMQHNIKLSLDIDGIPEIIRADERKFKQIIYNLLSNAVKFTPDGGSIALEACHLSFVDGHLQGRDGSKIPWPLNNAPGPAAPSNFVKIAVKDTGIGLRQTDLERIFAPFEQGDHSIDGIQAGTGLGLSLTKNFVELHGGRIWGESEGEGKGTTFRFVIPV
ncbi:MAG: HAMP domain-containing histidine kinase [Desulfobacterales bacterium]|nr:MAG: HAMP domain-containing histidine kinase [Desulfobacterales bacterium]